MNYRISVIIPVYNAAQTLARTMDSLFRQTMEQTDMEIILIDDGSHDESPALCDSYAAAHQNVKVIHQENAGVSTARNAGICAAQGKYLLYLDSDDTLSSETLENIANFFDDHYSEVDLVTYPLVYHYENGRVEEHWRSTRYLKNTGVYALKSNPCICQTTINVCVKNKKQGNVLFDTRLELAEDQLHNTIHLSEKGAIGFVREAEYCYFATVTGAVSSKMFSKKAFNDHVYAHNSLLNIGDQHPDIRTYCDYMVLYNLNWKIRRDSFLPYAVTGEAYDVAFSELVKITDRIPSKSILDFPNMD